MKPVRKILSRLQGLHYRQEYLCLSKESFANPLHAYLTFEGRIVRDITSSHAFVGYKPLLFALAASDTSGLNDELIEIALSPRHLPPNDRLTKKDAVACISFRQIHPPMQPDPAIVFYEGIKAEHSLLPKFNQFFVQLNNRLYNNKAGNVFLDNNLYNKVQIAYSIPRKICLVTVGQGGRYNLFPTDLHGCAGNGYIISLRHGGEACAQVESAKKIVLSDVHASAYKGVYMLGKNHMQPLKQRSAFSFNFTDSKNFNLPLPMNATAYKELSLEDSFIHGIHKLLYFKIINRQELDAKPETLAHIHNCYATWLHRNRISSNLLMR